MTLAKIVEGFKAGFIKPKADLDELTVKVDKTKPPKEGDYGFTTLLTVSDGSGQDSAVFIDGQHTPAIGSMATLTGVRFYKYEEPDKEKGGGKWHNLTLTAKGLVQSGSQAAQSQPGSQAPAGNGDKDARIERQSARRDAVMLVAGMLGNPEAKPCSEDSVFASVEKAYHFMLKITGTEALPAPGTAQSAGQPGQEAGQPAKPEGPGTFAEAAAAGAMLVKIMDGDQAKARQAFTNLTGSKTLSECPDQGCATSWLTIVTKIKRSFEELEKPDEQALFRETLVKPGLTPDERDSALENIVVGSALPF